MTLIALAAATLIELGLPYVIKFGIDNVINVEYSFTIKDSNPPTFVEDTKGTYVLKKIDNNYYMINKQTNETIEVPGEYYASYFDSAIQRIRNFSFFSLFFCYLPSF